MVKVVNMGLTSISLSWRVPGDSTLDSEVMWRELRGTSEERGGSGSSGSISSSTTYTIPDLQPLSVYNITVAVNTSDFGGTISESVVTFSKQE